VFAMPNPSLGSRSQQFSGLPSTSTAKDHPPKRTRDEFIESRFKFESAASQSKKLKPNLSTLVSSHSGLALESEDKKEHECHFTSALQTASIENLSIPFKRLYRTIEPISRSLPLLIYHQEHVVHACCEALIVSDSPSSVDQLDQSSSKTRLSSRSKKSQSSDLDKARKRRLIQAKDAVNLVATTVLDLFVPLILDLSTSLLTPSSSTEYAGRCPFDELLITLIYFINLTDVEPIALSKASELIVHLFKTLAKDLTPTSLPSTETESGENSQRLANIWNLVRNALGAPLPDDQQLTKVEDLSPDDDEVSDSDSDEDANENNEHLMGDSSKSLEEPMEPTNEDADIDLAEFTNLDHTDEAEPPAADTTAEFIHLDQNDETKPPAAGTTKTDSTPHAPNAIKLQQLLHQVLKSTTPSSRRLVATSFAYLLRKKGISEPLIKLMLNDLNTIEINEVTKHGALLPRKHKVQVARKGNSVRSLLGEEHGGARVFAEGICWALGETCKSVDHRLHSRASAIVNSTDSQVVQMSLLALQNAPQQPLLIHGVLNSLLISIIHHTTAQHFDPVLDSIAAKATERVASFKRDCASSATEKGTVALETSLNCLATVAGVRNGSRLSGNKMPNILHILGSVLDLLAIQIMTTRAR